MPRPRRQQEHEEIEMSPREIAELFREKVVSQHLKNKFFEYAQKCGEQFNCPVCLNDLKQPEAFCLLVCSHHLCFSCYHYLPEPKNCPLCRG